MQTTELIAVGVSKNTLKTLTDDGMLLLHQQLQPARLRLAGCFFVSVKRA